MIAGPMKLRKCQLVTVRNHFEYCCFHGNGCWWYMVINIPYQLIINTTVFWNQETIFISLSSHGKAVNTHEESTLTTRQHKISESIFLVSKL